jgi:hypothetical protein
MIVLFHLFDLQGLSTPFTRHPALCEPGGFKADYITTCEVKSLDLTVPYVNTTTEFVQWSASLTCSWVYDFNGTLTKSGLYYDAERLVDNNSVVWHYDKTLSGCETSCLVNNGTTFSMTINVSYGH